MPTAYKLFTILTLVGMMAVAALAQTNSKTASVGLIAVLPESISLAMNPPAVTASSLAGSGNSRLNVAVAASVTTSWALLPGRAEVATWAHLIDTSPVLLAVAMDTAPAGSPFWEPARDSAPRRIPLSKPTSHLKMSATNLTERGRTGASTVDLPLAIQEIRSHLMGGVKIQVETVP